MSINATLQALEAQRNSALNQVAQMAGQIEDLQEEIKSLKEENPSKPSPEMVDQI